MLILRVSRAVTLLALAASVALASCGGRSSLPSTAIGAAAQERPALQAHRQSTSSVPAAIEIRAGEA